MLRARASVAVALLMLTLTLAPACNRQPRRGVAPVRQGTDAGAPALERRGSWSDGPLFQVARGGHTATLLPDGRVLLVGGNGNLHVTERQGAESFDPAGQLDGTLYELPLRLGHTATRLPDGRVLILGGLESGRRAAANLVLEGSAMTPSIVPWRAPGHTATPIDGAQVLVLSAAAEPEPALLVGTGVGLVVELKGWHPTAHTATWLGGGRVLVVGDRAEAVGIVAPAPVVSVSPGPGLGPQEFTALPGGQGRMRHHAIALLDGRVLVFAGCTPPSCQRPVPAQLFDPRHDRLIDSATAGPALVDAIAVRLRDGRILVAGGVQVGDDTFTPRAEAELYDPGLDRWSPAAPMREARKGAAAVVLADGRVLVTGGQVTADGMDPFVRSTEIFTP
ncbi:MAG: hypothetical protein IT370_34515 [Deltaproteobacteria bacterium]|nr:hypothetical protein [Deltaproteobacteria bacterium]